MIGKEQQLDLVGAANRAPSVHNIQPTRFRFDDEKTITVLENPARRLHVGDPAGKDNQKSMGAALEGLVLALSERGIGAAVSGCENNSISLKMESGASRDPLAPMAATRQSYRGLFAPAAIDDDDTLAKLADVCADLHIIRERDEVAKLGRLYDEVSLEVVRDPAYRAELLSWMRLSRDTPNYWRDGLNADHMALSRLEAFGAGLVLGPGFRMLDTAGLAGPLMAEAGKVKSAVCVALFHRPAAEPEIDTGRRFYRVWLEIERLGLALCPMSVLADVPHSAIRLLGEAGFGADRKLVTVFRIGRRPAGFASAKRARLPPSELVAGTNARSSEGLAR